MAASNRRWRRAFSVTLVACTLFGARATHAQSPTAADSAEMKKRRAKFDSIEWLTGPSKGRLGDIGEIDVPKGCKLTQQKGADTYLDLTENIPDGNEVGLLRCTDVTDAEKRWFVIYTYDESGYVKDDEKGHLEPDSILASLRKGTEESNLERKKRGWSVMHIDGWVRPPYYNEKTNNLTWSLKGGDADSIVFVNESVRLLGRGGVLEAELVMNPEQADSASHEFDKIMLSTTFVPGSRYSEWKSGDKVAAYGLTALIAGGAGAVAMKSGLFAKLGAAIVGLWKLLAAGFLALATRLKSLFKRKPKNDGTPPNPPNSP
ncbi:MAG TPA: DUF2167 domain-containing protein [Gemmatimonadaceae bacterium]|nr:DUF2167 domain-containing protein [Gemmatimonadaceae bacterium]